MKTNHLLTLLLLTLFSVLSASGAVLKRVQLENSAAMAQSVESQASIAWSPTLVPPSAELLEAKLAPYIGKEITSLDDLQPIVRDILLHYQENDRPFVDVYIPEQDIIDGTVKIMVVESKVGKIGIDETKYFDRERILADIRQQAGNEIYKDRLDADLAWINQTPFLNVSSAMSKGTAEGTTDIQLKVQEERPWKVTGNYANNGSSLTGENRWKAGISHGNFLNRRHQIGYDYSTTNDTELFLSHSVNYTLPINRWHHTLSTYGSFMHTKSDLPAPFSQEGDTWQTGMRYTIPLKKRTLFTDLILEHSLNLGFDFKQSNSDLQYDVIRLSSNFTDVNQFALEYTATLPDSKGSTSFGASTYFSPGGISNHNDDHDFSAVRNRATADYSYFKLNLSRNQKLPSNFSFMASASTQFTQAALLSSEQFSVGGMSTVRGYKESAANGDNGYMFNTELRSPPISLSKYLKKDWKDQLTFFGFYDYGWVVNNKQLPGETDTTLAGTGSGLIYQVSSNFFLKTFYGWQLKDPNNDPDNSRGYLTITVSY